MFTSNIKKASKELIELNAKEKYLSGILLMMIPMMICTLINHYLGLFGDFEILIINFIMVMIISYLGVWFTAFSIKIIREKASLKDTIPDRNLLKLVIIPIIIDAIVASIVVVYGYEINVVIRGLLGIITFVIAIYLILIVISYIIEEGQVNQKIILKAFPEYLWKFIVLIISFIPLFFLIVITFGILAFWKITYIETAFRTLGFSVYRKYNEEKQIEGKYIFGFIIAIILIFLCSLGVGSQKPVYQLTYKVNAYNGEQYDFVAENNKIVSVSFDGLYNSLNDNNSDVLKTIPINGVKSHLVAVFNRNGDFEEVAVDTNNNIENLPFVNLNELLIGAKSHSKGQGNSLITFVVNENSENND